MILSKETAEKKLRRMALEVAERNFDKTELILIGIKENGIHIARKIADYLKDISQAKIELIELSLDKKHPSEITLDKKIDFNGKCILLIDDVANSGKTMLYALKPLISQHPAQIETLVLVERTHKKFPIATNYSGLSVSTSQKENIIVDVKNGVVMGAYIENNH